MYYFSKKISKKFAIDISGWHLIRNLKDGLTFVEFKILGDWFKGDHKPSFDISFVFCNFMIFEFNLYNINHLEEGVTK